MLDNWHHFDLAEVDEELIVFVLGSAIEYQVGTEHKDTCSHYWKDFQTFEANYSVINQEDLVNLEDASEAEEYPGEHSFKWGDAQRI